MTDSTSNPPIAAKSGEMAILAAKPADRAELILDSGRAASLVPAMPPEELLFTMRASTREEAVGLLSHATTTQARFILDVEIWQGEEVDVDRAGRMLELIDDCGVSRLERWLPGLEVTDLASLTGRLVASSFADEDGMPERDDGEDESSFTLDGTHIFTARSDQADRVRRLITVLRSVDHDKFLHLAEILASGYNAEDEEEAARFRRVRLAERGFADFAEARRIYAPLTPENLAALPPRVAATPAEEEEFPPLYPVTLAPTPDLLKTLLSRLAATEAGPELLRQLAQLTNLTVAADALPLGEESSFTLAALKVSGRLTIALELVHGLNEAAMEAALASTWLEHLFRVGHTRVAQAGAQARKVLTLPWPGGSKALPELIGGFEAAVLAGLAARNPRAARPAPSGFEYADFGNLAQLLDAEKVVAGVLLARRFTVEVLGVALETLVDGDEVTPISTVFTTALANGAAGRGFAFAPVDAAALPALLARITPESRTPLIENAVEYGQGKLSLDETSRLLLARFLGGALDALLEEAGALKGGAAPDRRFVRSILLTGS